MVFYKGAISYDEFLGMPIDTFNEVLKEANVMTAEQYITEIQKSREQEL